MASKVFSENGAPTTWRATGMFSANPQGSTRAGSPARLPIGMMEDTAVESRLTLTGTMPGCSASKK